MSKLFTSDSINFEALRFDVIEQFSSLLREHTFSDITRENTTALISALIKETADIVESKSGNMECDTKLHGKLSSYCEQLNNTVLLLNQQQKNKSKKYKSELMGIITRFNDVSKHLEKTILEKKLILKQSKILKAIISQYEHIAKWDVFLKKIASTLCEHFPFQFFLIAYKEDYCAYLNIYYGSEYLPDEKKVVQNKLIEEVAQLLSLNKNYFSEIRPFDIGNQKASVFDLEKTPMILLNSLDKQKSQLTNILGIFYLPQNNVNIQEKTILQAVLTVIGITANFSKTLENHLKELNYHATHDPLTKIHNRRYFNEILTYEISRSERHQHDFVILMIDLDNFKDINDSYGHAYGDMVLQSVANIMIQQVRKSDVVARIGGDEFALILMQTNMSNGQKSAEALRKKVSQLLFTEANGQTFGITISVGLMHYPSNAKTVSDLLAGVDVALYHAKKNGKNTTYLFNAEKDKLQFIRDTQSTVEMLRMALNEGRVVPYFQPIVDCKTDNIVAYEVLARLHTLDGKIQPATEFVDSIEKHGLSQLFNQTIIEQALRKQKAAQSNGIYVSLFINLSTQTIYNHNLLDYAQNLCLELDISPNNIIFEILEHEAIIDIDIMKKTLNHLNSLGFYFALDDFGTGYNSFHYLRELPFKYVKLDGSFVKGIIDTKVNYTLVKNIVHLCRELGIKTVAEYVESEEILNAVKSLGVDYAQGYYTGMPQDYYLENNHPPHKR